MKIRLVGAEIFFLIWTHGQEDMTKLIVIFRNFKKALRIAVLKASGGDT